jgi:hypothetical protein
MNLLGNDYISQELPETICFVKKVLIYTVERVNKIHNTVHLLIDWNATAISWLLSAAAWLIAKR